jgi:hypothetical protein
MVGLLAYGQMLKNWGLLLPPKGFLRVDGKPGAWHRVPLKKGDSMQWVIAVATAVLAVVALLGYLRDFKVHR